MTQEQLLLLAATALSLVFSYVPLAKNWYDRQSSATKQLVMLGTLFVIVAGSFGLSCAGVLATYACSWAGAWEATNLFILAMIANQGTYVATKYLHRGQGEG